MLRIKWGGIWLAKSHPNTQHFLKMWSGFIWYIFFAGLTILSWPPLGLPPPPKKRLQIWYVFLVSPLGFGTLFFAGHPYMHILYYILAA